MFTNPAAIRWVFFSAALLAGLAAVIGYLRRRRTMVAPTHPTASARIGLLAQGPSQAQRGIRVLLILLALVVAAGFALMVIPSRTMEEIAQTLQASKAADLPPDRIALLYLGDEPKSRDLQIRGIIRNISGDPIEKLDAVLRLYTPDNILLETVMVRLDQESISPDAISEFDLLYPNYNGQFASYSVEFKFRQGESVRYKDRRGTRHLN